MFDGLPGYADPRVANKQVFSGQLRDSSRQVPPGYRRDPATEDEWR